MFAIVGSEEDGSFISDDSLISEAGVLLAKLSHSD